MQRFLKGKEGREGQDKIREDKGTKGKLMRAKKGKEVMGRAE